MILRSQEKLKFIERISDVKFQNLTPIYRYNFRSKTFKNNCQKRSQNVHIHLKNIAVRMAVWSTRLRPGRPERLSGKFPGRIWSLWSTRSISGRPDRDFSESLFLVVISGRPDISLVGQKLCYTYFQ